MCGDCYGYASQLVWQWWAPDLWRRFTIALRRLLAKTLGVLATRLGEVATVQYAKVAEYQPRGVVHIPVGTLYQWRHRGVGPAAYRVGRHLLYDSAAMRRWLVEQAA